MPINIRNGVTAFVNGQQIVGNLPVLTYPVNPNNAGDWDYQFIAATGTMKRVYRNGVNYILGSYQIAAETEPDSWMFEGNRKMKMGFRELNIANTVNLTPDKLKQGVKILGITGNYSGGIDTSDATATNMDITLGKTAYVNGQKITGSVDYGICDDYIQRISGHITEYVGDMLYNNMSYNEYPTYDFQANFITPIMYSVYNLNRISSYQNLGSLFNYDHDGDLNIHMGLPGTNTYDSIDLELTGTTSNITRALLTFYINNNSALEYYYDSSVNVVSVNPIYPYTNQYDVIAYFSDIYGYTEPAVMNINTSSMYGGIDIVSITNCLKDLGIIFYDWGMI